jgi:hypothetical protein
MKIQRDFGIIANFSNILLILEGFKPENLPR